MNVVSEPTRGRRLLKTGAWALGGIGSALTFGANVKVEEAKTNIGGWINFFGIDRIPGFLLSAYTDFAVMALGVVGIALAAFIHWRGINREKKASRLAADAVEEAALADGRSIFVEGVPMKQPRHLPGHGRGGFDDY